MRLNQSAYLSYKADCLLVVHTHPHSIVVERQGANSSCRDDGSHDEQNSWTLLGSSERVVQLPVSASIDDGDQDGENDAA